jgi:hypothetical protein
MLGWEVVELIIHTSHGDSDYNSSHGIDPLITRNVAVSSDSGYIFGEYVANGNLTLHNDRGGIGLWLIPLYGKPFKPESISVSTHSGTIHVEAPIPDWPVHQPYTHTTNIHTVSGELWAYIPHGSFTNLSNAGNLFAARLQPYGAASPTDLSEIYTYSNEAWTYVRVDDVDPEALKDHLFNPLYHTKSQHYLGDGTLELKYPYSWSGSMKARIENGSLKFDSSALEYFESDEGFVKARKGNNGDSQLDVQVGSGELDILLGLQI